MSTQHPTTSLAVITGGGTGIGRALGELLVSHGWEVRALGLDADADLPASIRFHRCDVRDEVAVAAALADVDEVKALVTCAAVLRPDEWVAESFGFVLSVNVTAVLAIGELLRSRLARAEGSIVNFASMWSYFGSPKSPAYAASKGAIVALTRSQAVAYAADGVRANAVAPGWIATPMSKGARADAERLEQINSRIPLGRWGEASEVAQAVEFLVSDNASYITGTVLDIDGGFSVA